jgi:hypothetical protein
MYVKAAIHKVGRYLVRYLTRHAPRSNSNSSNNKANKSPSVCQTVVSNATTLPPCFSYLHSKYLGSCYLKYLLV